jgi:hypothetical protein
LRHVRDVDRSRVRRACCTGDRTIRLVTLAILTATIAQLLDLGTFVRMIGANGVEAEANPLVAHLLTEFGLPFAIVAKLAVLALAVAVAVVLSDRPDNRRAARLGGAVAGVAVVAGLVGGLSNAAVLV